jgi:hypothetical protein
VSLPLCLLVQRDVDRGLRVGVAARHAVHAGVQLLDLGDIRTGDGGKQDLLDCGRRQFVRDRKTAVRIGGLGGFEPPTSPL